MLARGTERDLDGPAPGPAGGAPRRPGPPCLTPGCACCTADDDVPLQRRADVTVQRDVDPRRGSGPEGDAGADQALIDREDQAIARLRGLQGGSAGSFVYGSPSSPDLQPPNEPPAATLTLGALVLRPTSDTQRRRSFETREAAEARATVAIGPAGAAVAREDGLWFVFGLAAASASELKRDNVHRFTPSGPVVSVIGTDRMVFTNRAYTPDPDRAALDPRAERSVARPADAAALRDLAGMTPGAPGAPRRPGTAIPASQAEPFIRAYFQARALEALEQNRKLALDLTEKFKPQQGGKLGGDAKALMDQARELGGRYQELEDKERQVGETALLIRERHLEGRWNLIAAKGRTQTYHQWIDEINGLLGGIHTGKEEVLALSPLLASLVFHAPGPRTAGDWSAKLGWERSAVRRGIRAVAWPIAAASDWLEKDLQGAPSWKDSELSKASSEAGDRKVAAEFLRKLDAVNQAISRTVGSVVGGDVDDLLSMGGLRSRVEADIGRLGPENQAVKDKFRELVLDKALKDAVVEIGGTVVSVAALCLPGGQFISAAIGMGMAMQTMSGHLGQLDAGQAAVDPAHALVDQQELAKQLLFDTLAVALSAAEVAAEVKGAMDAVEQGGVRQAAGGTPDAPLVPPGAGAPGRTVPDAVADIPDGHVHVTADGRCLVCFSPCDDVRTTFGPEIREEPGLGGEVSAVEKRAREAGAATDPAAALKDVLAVAVAAEKRLHDAAVAARITKVTGLLQSLAERFPVLAVLDRDAIGRIVRKAQRRDQLKGQLFEELAAHKVKAMMQTAEGRAALGAGPGEKLELIPGHLVREYRKVGPGEWRPFQFSDGLVVVRSPDGTIDRVVSIIEAKSGVFSASKLQAETEGLRRLSDAAAKLRRTEAIEEFRDRRAHDPRVAGLTIDEIDERYGDEIGKIAKSLNQKEGQANRDLEAFDQSRIEENRNGTWQRVAPARAKGKPNVLGVVPSDVDAKALTETIGSTDRQVPFTAENHDLDSETLRVVAGEIHKLAKIPAG
ncbi:MAG TPA: hypothetical protein VFI47_24120 [Acidimicrobiales bacterium]|nr:hypothetical protein [Acidimicrobiales bacterium]